MEGHTTQYGFEYGPVQVSRACCDDHKGWVLLMLETKKHPYGIQVYVTKTGKVRIYSADGEWTPTPKVQKTA